MDDGLDAVSHRLQLREVAAQMVVGRAMMMRAMVSRL